jgi:hypothetical protein
MYSYKESPYYVTSISYFYAFLQLFFLDFLLKFSTSQLIHLYFGNLYTYVKLHELLKITTSKIF